MLKGKIKLAWIAVLAMVILNAAAVLADVLVYCLDISGSMKKHGKFEAAKTVLIEQIEAARPGDVIYVIAFDTNDYPLGRLDVGEDGSQEVKEKLIAKIRSLQARGLYTNLDEPLQAAKALLLEERTSGARKIIILSDGLSDPSPDHARLDLQGIGEMIPQDSGWSVYLVGLPEDIEGLFQTPPQETGIVLAPENQHIKGIALEQFSREKIEEAVTVAKEDVTVPAPPPALAALSEPVQETPTPPSQEVSSTPVEQETVVEEPQETTPEPSPLSSLPLLWFISATVLAVLGAVALFVPRRASGPQRTAFTLEVREGEEDIKQFPLAFSEGAKRTIGAKGDIPLSDPELPAVVCTLHWSKGQLYLTPQDTISVNGQAVTEKIPVGVGDRIKVREKVNITINEGGTNP